ncbi:MAG: flagellin N-terminal helical domain-containing protein [Phycisphaerales bacterium]
MGRINTNVPSLIAQANLNEVNNDLQTRLERLATGVRLNRGKDDPAGLIISERIRSDIEGITQGIDNATRASSVIATAESSLAEVSDLLNSIRALIVESANTGGNSAEERQANQLQIDSAIESITRIANTSTFGGLKLLDGSLDYTLSGVAASAVSNARVYSANFVGSGPVQVDVSVLASAQTGSLYLSGFNAGTGGQVTSSSTFRIAGTLGVGVIEVVSGTSLADLVAAVNNLRSITGVSASLISATDPTSGVVFNSTEYGSDAFVSVERIGGPSDPTQDTVRIFKADDAFQVPAAGSIWGAAGANLTAANRDDGRDVTALVNGTLANSSGLTLNVFGPTLSLELDLNVDLATTLNSTTSFNITGGGALFQLGPEVTALQQTSVGIQSVASENLGGSLVNGRLNFLSSIKSGQSNDIRSSVARNDFSQASDIIDAAIDEVSVLRGRLGAFERNTLETNTRSLQAAFENLTASASKIRDADFALETSRLTRAQTLSQAATSTLALANQQAAQVLSLLG